MPILILQVTETTVINGGGTIGLDTRTLTAASGERNDGIANTGVRLLRTSGSESNVISWYGHFIPATNPVAQIEWLEIDAGQLAVKVLILPMVRRVRAFRNVYYMVGDGPAEIGKHGGNLW